MFFKDMAFYPSKKMSGHAASDPGVKIAPKWRFGAKNHDFRPPGGEGGIGVVQNGHLGVKMTKISIFPNSFGILALQSLLGIFGRATKLN